MTNHCPKCKAEKIARDPARGIEQCSECGYREAHGQRMPRIVVSPYEHDRRFVVVHFDDQQFVIDPSLAKMLATSLLSIT